MKNRVPADLPLPLSEKMLRGNLMAVACPSRDVLRHVTSRWGVLVLIALGRGTQRFSELRRTINGVSERMLAQTLQALEGDRLVHRVAHNVVPPHVDYSLTELGREAEVHVRALADWIELNMPRIKGMDEAQPVSPETATRNAVAPRASRPMSVPSETNANP